MIMMRRQVTQVFLNESQMSFTALVALHRKSARIHALGSKECCIHVPRGSSMVVSLIRSGRQPNVLEIDMPYISQVLVLAQVLLACFIYN